MTHDKTTCVAAVSVFLVSQNQGHSFILCSGEILDLTQSATQIYKNDKDEPEVNCFSSLVFLFSFIPFIKDYITNDFQTNKRKRKPHFHHSMKAEIRTTAHIFKMVSVSVA